MNNKTLHEQTSFTGSISAPPDFVPLFVDLDESLIKTDLLIESAFFLFNKTAVDVIYATQTVEDFT